MVYVEVATLAFLFGESKTSEVITNPYHSFRCHRLLTKVEVPELIYITEVNTGNRSGGNQLISPIDAWECSSIRLEKLQADFLEEHGLKGKTIDEIQMYLDESSLIMPSLPYLDFPPVKKGEEIRMTIERKQTDCMFQCILVGSGAF